MNTKPGFGREFERELVMVNPTEATVEVSTETAVMDSATGDRRTLFLVPPQDAIFLLRPGVSLR